MSNWDACSIFSPDNGNNGELARADSTRQQAERAVIADPLNLTDNAGVGNISINMDFLLRNLTQVGFRMEVFL